MSHELERFKRLQSHVAEMNLDAAVLASREHVQYLTGAVTPHAILVMTPSDAWIALPDDVVTEADLGAQVRQLPFPAYTLETLPDAPSAAIATIRSVLRGGLHRVGIEPHHLTAAVLSLVEGARLHDLEPTLLDWRRRKAVDEVATIRRNVQILEAAMLAAASELRAGVSEAALVSAAYGVVASAVDETIRLDGNVSVGNRTALPAPLAGSQVARLGDLVMIDLYPLLGGYCADLTRMFAVGETVREQVDRHRLVLTAIEEAEKLLRAGVETRSVDARIRSVLRDGGGYDVSMEHHSGHGIGLSQWEEPWFAPGAQSALQEGDVVAIEPGLYVPGWGGIRIESNYLITSNGAERLDSLSRDLVSVA